MRSKISIIKSHLEYFIMFLDMLIIILSGVSTYWLRFSNFYNLDNVLWAIIISSIVWVVLCRKNNLYHNFRGRSITSIILSLTNTWITWIFILSLLVFLTKIGVFLSRAWLILFSIQVLILIIVQRGMICNLLNWMREKGYNNKSILFMAQNQK